jgi:hypothetical protein
MEAPGENVILGERPAARTAAPNVSLGYVAGFSERGPLDEAVLLVSITDAEDKLGLRLEGNPEAYDVLDAAFHEGVAAIYFARCTGDAPVKASKVLVDAEGKTCLTVSAKDVGEYGNSLKAKVVLAGEEATITIETTGGKVLESSGAKKSVAALIEWATNISNWVDAAAGESIKLPKTQTITLTGGKANLNEADSSNLAASLALLPKDLGPGQVSVPNFAGDELGHLATMVHCGLNNRRALLDDKLGASVAELIASATALRGAEGKAGRFAAYYGSWAIVPGQTVGTTRTCPYSGVQMGLIARAEAEGNSPNRPAAGGKRGKTRWALGLETTFSEAERAELNAAGVTCAIIRGGVPVTFGNRTLTNPETDGDWRSFSASRTVMAVAETTRQVLEGFEFEDIDGHGYVFKELQGEIEGRACKPLYENNALYGDLPADAYAVNTGPQVNTPASIEAEEIRAQVAIRTSPTGERLVAEVVKVPIAESL